MGRFCKEAEKVIVSGDYNLKSLKQYGSSTFYSDITFSILLTAKITMEAGHDETLTACQWFAQGFVKSINGLMRVGNERPPQKHRLTESG